MARRDPFMLNEVGPPTTASFTLPPAVLRVHLIARLCATEVRVGPRGSY